MLIDELIKFNHSRQNFCNNGYNPASSHANLEDGTMVDGPKGEPRFDVFAAGMLFYDIVASNLPATGPIPGREIWTSTYAHGPGGIANFAMTTARLGLTTAISAAIGTDMFGNICAEALTDDEGIDLSYSSRLSDWATPVTMALGYEGDRALVTAGIRPPAPVAADRTSPLPPSRFAIAHLENQTTDWLREMKNGGAKIVADVGWDDSDAWDPHTLDDLQHCFAFIPNAREAMAYTSTESPEDAARALSERVPVSIVTCGGDGAIGVDSRTGDVAHVPPLPVRAVDSTGAGDVFGGAIVYAFSHEWPLEQSLSFAALVAGLSTRRPGGGISAPRWPEIDEWLRELTARDAAQAVDLRRRYEFLSGGHH